jgi:hypothetical protein
MSRVFLCGTTSREYQNIKELTDPIYEHIDGLIWTVDEGALKDGTYELLDERKGEGAILQRRWVQNHSYSHNHWLLDSGVLKPGDVFLVRDSMERFHPDFASKIKDYISGFIFNGYKTFFNFGKLFGAIWNDSMVFDTKSSPHWALVGWQQKAIDLKQFHDEDKKEWTWRVRDGEPGGRPIDNKIDHEAKYLWCYGRSNHLLLNNEDNYDQYLYLDAVRLHIRDQARLHGFEMTLDGLKQFMDWITSDERDEQTRKNGLTWINSHRVYRNFYRKYILGHKWEDIEKGEEDWRLEL